MSLVVSDSGPIHYLVLCEVIEVLPKLYRRLVIPPAVVQELIHSHAPPTVSQWIRAMPPWASVQSPLQIEVLPRLGLGEREAIALALELEATQLLVDDRVARCVADKKRHFDCRHSRNPGAGCGKGVTEATGGYAKASEYKLQD